MASLLAIGIAVATGLLLNRRAVAPVIAIIGVLQRLAAHDYTQADEMGRAVGLSVDGVRAA